MSTTSSKPETTPLWGHLLPLPTARTANRPKGNPLSSVPPLTPIDKTGTTLRSLLQDTQCALEKFSGRLDTLFSGLDSSQQSISLVGKLFEETRVTTTEETRSIGTLVVYMHDV